VTSLYPSYKPESKTTYVLSGLPGGGIGDEICHLRLRLVCVCTL